MTERALGKEQKEQRRREIVDVALELFETQEYDEITMASVARGTGLAKGTVYLYFDTKAALFLNVARRLIADWFQALDEKLQTLSDPINDPEVVGALVARTVAEADELRRTMSILPTIIERNIAPDEAADYKEKVAEYLSVMAARLADVVSGLSVEDGYRFFLWLYAFVVGLDQLANPPAPVREAIKARQLDVFDLDLETQLAAATSLWLRGLQQTD